MEEEKTSGDCVVRVDRREYPFDAQAITGAEVAALAGLQPTEAHVIVRIADGRASAIAPDTHVQIAGAAPDLRSGRAARPWNLYFDGAPWDWVSPGIMESEVREIAGLADGDSIYVEGSGEPLRYGALIDLTASAPRLSSRPTLQRERTRGVPVIVNGRPLELAEPDATFEDLVKLAFPQLPAVAGRTFTVTYRRGDAARPDGSLIPRQVGRLAPGAVINVSSTTKS